MIPPLLLLAAPSAGAPTAQEAPPVARRQKVRVWVPTAGIQGTTETVGRVTADGFDLRVRRPETVLPIPFALVERLKVGRGTRRRRGRPGGRHRGGVRRAGGPLEPRPSMRTRLLPPLLLLAGCEGVLDPEPSGDLGRALTGEEVGGMDEWWMPYLAWSPDGAEIFYRARESAEPRSEIRAVEVATGRTRVALATPSRRIESWALAGAGLYYSLDETIVSGPVLESPVLRVPAAGGAPTTVVDAASPWFAVSADERLVAYTSTREVPIGVGREYLYLRDVTAGTTRRLEYESAPIAFSPDRTELLAGDPFGLPTYRVYPVPGGAGRQVWGGASAGADLRGASWADGSLRLLSSRYAVQGDRAILTLAVRDPAGGTERTVATLRDLPAFTYWTSWSPSGRWIAAWVPGGCGFGLCARREWTLQMVDAGSGTARVLARGTFGFGSYPVFSPDERRVAYVLDGAVYLKELP